MSFIKDVKVRSSKILKSCKGQTCKLRIATKCSSQDTVVGCHVSFIGAVMGGKVSDIFIYDGCHDCHAIEDGRAPRPMGLSRETLEWARARAMQETQQRLINEELITIK